MARIVSWLRFEAHPERYIIQLKFGLIQVMREKLKSESQKVSVATACRLIEGLYA